MLGRRILLRRLVPDLFAVMLNEAPRRGPGDRMMAGHMTGYGTHRRTFQAAFCSDDAGQHE
jgi:hypothetical protein